MSANVLVLTPEVSSYVIRYIFCNWSLDLQLQLRDNLHGKLNSKIQFEQRQVLKKNLIVCKELSFNFQSESCSFVGTPESQSEDAGSRKEGDSCTNSPSKSPRKHIPPLSTRCVLGERQQNPSKFRAKLLTSSNSLDSYLEAGTRKHLSFVRMISLQSAQGSWNLDCSFAEVLGFQLPDIQASSPLADNSVYIAEDLRELMTSDKCDNSSQLWATALALSWFHRKRCQFEAEWTLSVKKAEEWMHREPCPRGFLPEDLKTLAYQALLLLETETRRARSASVDATPRNKEDGCDWRWTVSLGSLLSNKDGKGNENVT